MRDWIKQETAGADKAEKYADVFYFRRQHKADHVLVLFKRTIERGHVPSRWVFLQHDEDRESDKYCLVTRGVTFGYYPDAPNNELTDDFGGAEHCAVGDGEFSASEKLRYWANRTLGKSSVLYVTPPQGPGYQFVIANSEDWVIIQDEAEKSCLYDRGTDVRLRFNLTAASP